MLPQTMINTRLREKQTVRRKLESCNLSLSRSESAVKAEVKNTAVANKDMIRMLDTTTVEVKARDLNKFNLRLWLLPVAGCLIQTLTSGSYRSDSLIYVALMEEERLDRLQASLPFAVIGIASIVMAPVLGIFGLNKSFFYVCSWGLFLYNIGQVVCYLSTEIYAVIFFFGFIKSCGAIVVSIQVQQIIMTSFKENKATAMGIATMGVPLGGFIWPYLTNFFLEEYGLKGTFLLCAGVSLHSLIGIIVISGYTESRNEPTNTKGFKRNEHKSVNEFENKAGSPQSKNVTDLLFRKSGENKFFSHQDSKTKLQDFDLYRSPCLVHDLRPSYNIEHKRNFFKESEKTSDHKSNIKPRESLAISKKLLLKNIFTNRVFYLLTLTNSMNLFVQNAFGQVVVDYMLDKRLQKSQALYMITLYAGGGLFGRTGFGWLTDKMFLTRNRLKSLSLFISGTTLVFCTWTTNYYSLCLNYFILGICQAATQTLNLVQYSTYFYKHEVLMALSASKFLQGFVQLCKAPTIGLVRDLLGSYDYFFGSVSVLLYIVSLLWLHQDFTERNGKSHWMEHSIPDSPEN